MANSDPINRNTSKLTDTDRAAAIIRPKLARELIGCDVYEELPTNFTCYAL